MQRYFLYEQGGWPVYDRTQTKRAHIEYIVFFGIAPSVDPLPNVEMGIKGADNGAGRSAAAIWHCCKRNCSWANCDSHAGKTSGDNIYERNNPSGRYTLPQEIASLAVYMVSGAGEMIVGDTIYMTGGSGTISLHR